MSKEVKRYEAVHIRYEDGNIRYGEGCEVEVVTAADYDALRTELTEADADFVRIANERDALLAERDALKDALAEARSSLEYIGRLSIEVSDYAKTKSGCARAAMQGEQS